MKTINVIGANGNMGRRYTAILKYLGYTALGSDLDDSPLVKDNIAKHSDGFIVATPTNTHIPIVSELFQYQKPILCEKPLTTQMHLLEDFEDRHRTEVSWLTMVNQYAYLDSNISKGQTFYDYWNSGKDGIGWDHVNIIGMSRGIVRIKDTSPFWLCTLNGKKLSADTMDFAYMEMIEDWAETPKSNYTYARKAHDKVSEWLQLYMQSKRDQVLNAFLGKA